MTRNGGEKERENVKHREVGRQMRRGEGIGEETRAEGGEGGQELKEE